MMKTAHVQLDVVRLLLAIEHVEGRALGHEEHALELELALHGEVLHREGVLPVVGEGLVEGGVELGLPCALTRPAQGCARHESLTPLFKPQAPSSTSTARRCRCRRRSTCAASST